VPNAPVSPVDVRDPRLDRGQGSAGDRVPEVWAGSYGLRPGAGLRINAKCQVVDRAGQVMPGLYCGGESAGGFSQHGLARALVQGLIAARSAMEEPSTTCLG
jgi:hypothetical protein